MGRGRTPISTRGPARPAPVARLSAGGSCLRYSSTSMSGQRVCPDRAWTRWPPTACVTVPRWKSVRTSGRRRRLKFSANGGTANTSMQTLFVRRAFAYVAGDRWGVVRLGEMDGTSYLVSPLARYAEEPSSVPRAQPSGGGAARHARGPARWPVPGAGCGPPNAGGNPTRMRRDPRGGGPWYPLRRRRPLLRLRRCLYSWRIAGWGLARRGRTETCAR